MKKRLVAACPAMPISGGSERRAHRLCRPAGVPQNTQLGIVGEHVIALRRSGLPEAVQALGMRHCMVQ